MLYDPNTVSSRLLDALRTLTAKSHQGIALLDSGCRYVALNQELASLDEHPPEAHIGNTVADVVPELWKAVGLSLLSALTTFTPRTDLIVVAPTLSKPANPRYWLISCYPTSALHGASLGLLCVVSDVTGHKFIERSIADIGLFEYHMPAFETETAGAILTRRERDVLVLIGQGKTTKEIATALGITGHTVASYRKSICNTLRLHSTAELAAYSARAFRSDNWST
jgi:DNA-binding CsgD family transcriptional regulator